MARERAARVTRRKRARACGGGVSARPPPFLLLPLPMSLLYTPSVDNSFDVAPPPPPSLLLPLPVSLLYTQ